WRQQATILLSICYVGPTSFLVFSRRRWWSFFVANGPDAKLVLGEYSWVQRNLVPISECITAFEADCLKAAAALKAFGGRFRGKAESVWKTHFHFFGEEVIRSAVIESAALVNCSEIKCPRWQNVSAG